MVYISANETMVQCVDVLQFKMQTDKETHEGNETFTYTCVPVWLSGRALRQQRKD